ncbi:hypothetical protein ACFVT2_19540 [Streptomyces sp. NPDC058000]|uniref:hypothetical protein n=1 Tax=Streptomyces sp. NPDC058000 TaxID=3346299 RepID=UPI0036E0656E
MAASGEDTFGGRARWSATSARWTPCPHSGGPSRHRQLRPPRPKDATCAYTTDRASTKLRWALTADRAEKDALAKIAAGHPDSTVGCAPAP